MVSKNGNLIMQYDRYLHVTHWLNFVSCEIVLSPFLWAWLVLYLDKCDVMKFTATFEYLLYEHDYCKIEADFGRASHSESCCKWSLISLSSDLAWACAHLCSTVDRISTKTLMLLADDPVFKNTLELRGIQCVYQGCFTSFY